MNAIAGGAGATMALMASILGVATLGMGLRAKNPRLLRAGQRYAWLVLAGAVLASAAMEAAFVSHDFSLRYVADNGSRSTPLLYTITGMWSGLEGSILLWGLVLSGYLAMMAHRFRHRATDPLVAWAMLTALVVSAFFFALTVGPANPFRLVDGAVPEGDRKDGPARCWQGTPPDPDLCPIRRDAASDYCYQHDH